jgi:hypothetical protein
MGSTGRTPNVYGIPATLNWCVEAIAQLKGQVWGIVQNSYLPKLSGVSTEYLNGNGTWSTPAGGGGGGGSIDDLTGALLVTITDADNFVFDGDSGTIQTITLGESRTFAISNLKVGIPYTFIVKQDGGGSRVLTWSTTTKVAYGGSGTPAISSAANAIDIYQLISDGTNIYCTYGINYTSA